MKTSLYKNLGKAFLVFHVANEDELPNLNKFASGKSMLAREGYVISNSHGDVPFNIGDYVVNVASQYGRTVPVEINGNIVHLPQNSMMVLDPDNFHNNFEEMIPNGG